MILVQYLWEKKRKQAWWWYENGVYIPVYKWARINSLWAQQIEEDMDRSTVECVECCLGKCMMCLDLDSIVTCDWPA